MVEIPICRLCAVCCYRCLFLELKDGLFGCLIYNNKGRSPFPADIFKLFNDEELEVQLLWRIQVLIEGHKSGVCDSHYCTWLNHFVEKGKFRKKDYRLFSGDYTKLVRSFRETTQKIIQEGRNHISDFKSFVETMNNIGEAS